MRRISLRKAKENMILAKDIYSSDGKILLSEGQTLNKQLIKKLIELGFDEIIIKDSEIPNINADDVIAREIKEEVFALVHKTFENNMLNTENLNEEIKKVVEKVVFDIISKKEILINLNDIRGINNYNLYHSLNVMIYSILIGIKLNYTHEKLIDLGIGSMLHDVGKVKIPKDIICKKGPLHDKEYEMVKMHTIFGFDTLYSEYKFDQHICEVPLLHHERLDGSGYPFGKTREQIPEMVKIATISDVFDALTNEREYRKKIKPHIAIEYLLNSCGTHFDSYLVSKFVTYVSLFPVGTTVLLNTGEKGIVIYNNSKFPSRPIVRVLYGSDDKKLIYRKDIDLSLNYNYYVLDILDNI